MHPTLLSRHLAACALVLSTPVLAQVSFYEGEGFRGRVFSTGQAVSNLVDQGFNDRAGSAIVERGGWEVCEDVQFRGRCVVLRRGSYDSLRGLGLDKRISSVRPVNAQRRYGNEGPAPLPEPTYDFRQRPHETLYNVPVTSVHAVMGPPERRCWMEREQVSGGDPNVGGALAGALLGGILGHQIGGGGGRGLATAGGAVAGAVIGGQVGRSGSERDVQRCNEVASGLPVYWDVDYVFQGLGHRVQMATAPGPTITVNQQGEPRQ